MNAICSKEKEFHDDWALSIDITKLMVTDNFEACTAPENRLIKASLGPIDGKKMLELGCGAGEASIYLASKGAVVTATDISSKMLSVANRLAQKHNVSIETKQCASDNIQCNDEEYDIVYAANLLHHVDIEITLKEISRILKKGGIFASWDPLAHNPLINIYRILAVKVRTAEEHPLRMDDLILFRKYFSEVQIHMTWFFCLWIFIRFYLIERIDPNKERYWKKILTEHERLRSQYTFLERIDNFFLKLFPFMRRYCWNVTVIARK